MKNLLLKAFFSLLLSLSVLGCTRGIQLTRSQEGAGVAGAPTGTTISVGGSAGGGVVTTDNLIVFIRTSAMSFPQVDADGVMFADPFLETGIQEVFSRIDE